MRIPYQGFVGPASMLSSPNVDSQQAINIYPEIVESGLGKEGNRLYYKSVNGLLNIKEVGDGPIRLVHFDNTPKSALIPDTRVLVVSGDELYKLVYNTSTLVWDSTLLGTLGTSTGVVRAASANIDLGITVLVDGIDQYRYRAYESSPGVVTEQFDSFTDLTYPTVERPVNVIWLDGYFIYNSSISNQFYVSDWNTITADPLSFASAEGDPDDIMAIIANQRNLWILNERTYEIWSNVGNADFPFERVAFVEKGTVASHSVAQINDTVFWLGRDKSGQGSVYASQGTQFQRISTHALEQAIAGYADISSANAYTFEQSGHSFYVLNFAEATWVYDMSTQLWHQRVALIDGELTRHRASFHTFVPEFGIHMLGDYEDNRIYQLSSTHFYDDEYPLTRIRTGPHISNKGEWIVFNSFQLDVETGVGLNGSGQGSSPIIILQWSDDGGHTWSNEKEASIGTIGARSTRVIWRRLGRSRDRVFRVIYTEPTDLTIMGAWIDMESEAS
jgi:hypothetical protein